MPKIPRLLIVEVTSAVTSHFSRKNADVAMT
jgi:hypothetical protein